MKVLLCWTMKKVNRRCSIATEKLTASKFKIDYSKAKRDSIKILVELIEKENKKIVLAKQVIVYTTQRILALNTFKLT